MILKKQYRGIIVYFDIVGDSLTLNNENILNDIITSLDDFKFINREQPFNKLVKEQQKYNKHILVEYEPKMFDEQKFIVKAIYNFLVETNQHTKFILDRVNLIIDDDEIIIYGAELLRENLSNNTTFSPTIRACWNKPDLIEKILKRH